MPESKYYEVEQTRVLKVTANSAVDATRIASEAFDAGLIEYRPGMESADLDVWGRTIGNIEVTTLHISQER